MGSDSPNIPILDWANPSIVLDTILVEQTGSKIGNYGVLEPGAPFKKETHSAAQVEQFEGHEFLGQKATSNPEVVQRFYGKVPSTQDIANWERAFSGESNSHPIFQRRYLEKRDSYTPRTKLAALPGLYRINVTAPGANFTSPPTVVFTGGTGSGAEAIAVLDNDGGIAKVIIKAEGTYTVAPSVGFVGGGGTGATATAEVQPSGAVLVKEDVSDNAPEPYKSLYIVVTRLYMTLPGPWIPFTRYDDNRGPIQGQRRLVVYTGQVASLTSTIKTSYEAWEGSSFVAWEIQEIFGAGVSGFIAYPVLGSATLSVDVRGRLISTSVTTVAAGTSPDTGPLVISSRVEAINEVISTKTTVSIASLPADEVYAFWDWVNLPLCIRSITHTVTCNDSGSLKVITNYDSAAGSAVFRKHRRTISYSTTAPNTTPDLSASAFETADLHYVGAIISIGKSNVLNDAINYSAPFALASGGSACGWTEAYNFPATSPTATEFLAGAWHTKSYDPRPFGQSMWRTEKIEYYSAQGNPSIT